MKRRNYMKIEALPTNDYSSNIGRALTACLMAFVISLSFPATTLSQYQCDISSGSGMAFSGSITPGDADQAANVAVLLSTVYVATTCLRNVGVSTTGAGTFNHDAYVYTNLSGQPACVWVRLETSCSGPNAIIVTAYSTYDPAEPHHGVIGLLGRPSTAAESPSFFSFPLGAAASATLVVSEVTPGAGCASYSLFAVTKTLCRQPGFERSADGVADFAVYRPGAPATWFYKASPDGTVQQRTFGTTGDIPTHGERTGDDLSDLVVYRPFTNTHYSALNDAATSFSAVQWGTAGDVPVPGDFDGDGQNDLTVFRPSTGEWYVLRSAGGAPLVVRWGVNGDIPVSGDFDGDFRADFAVVRRGSTNYRWYVLLSNFNYSYAFNETTAGPLSELGAGMTWGLTTDKIVTGDYTGDGRTDMGVWRPSDGTFYIRSYLIPGFAYFVRVIKWGAAGDIPQPADFDGDKTADAAIYRPSTNTFWVQRSSTLGVTVAQLGAPGDQPVSAPYRIQ